MGDEDDFGFDDFTLAERPVRYTVHGMRGEGDKPPVFLVSPATEANKAFYNAALKQSLARQAAVKYGGVNVDSIQRTRRDNRGLFAKHVVKGWEGVMKGGAAFPFTAANAAELIGDGTDEKPGALPDPMFIALFDFCTDESNFRAAGVLLDGESTAKK